MKQSPDRNARRRLYKYLLQLPVIRPLRARGLLLPVALGLVVIVTLIHGSLSREPHVEARPPAPGDIIVEPMATPPPTSDEILENLRPDLEKAPLSYHSDYWHQLGGITRPKITLIGRYAAVVLLRGLALTSIAAAEPILAEQHRRIGAARDAPALDDDAPAFTVPAEEQALGPGYHLIGVDIEIGAALFRVDEPHATVVFSSAQETAAGALIAGISLTDEGAWRVVPGHLSSATRLAETTGDLDAAVNLSDSVSVAAIVDLDGGLVGVALGAEDGVHLWSYARIAEVVARLVSDPVCQSIEVSAISAPIAEHLEIESGLLVERVRNSAFAQKTGVLPGDILLDWNGQAATNEAEFARLYRETPAGARTPYRVLRGLKRIKGTTLMPAPDCRPVDTPGTLLPRLGVRLEWEAGPETPGWRVADVLSNSPAQDAGLAQGDWIVAVNRRPLREHDLSTLDGFERRSADALLTVRRDERVQLLLATQPPG